MAAAPSSSSSSDSALLVDSVLWQCEGEGEDRERGAAELLAVRAFREVGRIMCRSGTVPLAEVRRRVEAMRQDRAQLAKLLEAPGIAQRTPEWYAARQDLVTASDIAQALGCAKFGTQRDFFIKKSGHEPPAPFNANVPPLKWGIMFEPVANDVYGARNGGIPVHEFGLLRHPTMPHLGASPDGITAAGVMVEIKCPYRRKITGEVPTQYYYQIQGQLEVCGLRECDYMECEFAEYEDRDAFMADTTCQVTATASSYYTAAGMERGAIAEYRRSAAPEEPPSYLYSPLCPSAAQLGAWEDGLPTDDLACIRYWRLVKYSVIRVSKDDAFVAKMIADVTRVWQRVLAYRADKALYEREVGAAGTGIMGTSTSSYGSKAAVSLPTYAFVVDDDDDAV